MSFAPKLFPVFEIGADGLCTCPQGNKCSSPGKHPRTANGYKDATSDVEQQENWRKTYPATNWGMATGEVVVVDIDPRNGGDDSFALWEKQNHFPATREVITGSGGRHLYYRNHTAIDVGNRTNIVPGVDIKGRGGYVIIPPSNHVSGNAYQYVDRDTPIANIPEWLLKQLSQKPKSADEKFKRPSLVGLTKGWHKGERNHKLFLEACRLRRALPVGSRDRVTTLIKDAASHCDPPYEEYPLCIGSAYAQDHSDRITHPLTDRGNKDRFIDCYGHQLRHVLGQGWIVWERGEWEPQNEITNYTETISDLVRDNLSPIMSEEQQSRLQKWAHRCESASAIGNVGKLAKDDLRVSCKPDDLDKDKHLFRCKNGVVDLRNGKIIDVEPEMLITKMTECEYDSTADMTRWLDFLRQSLNGNLTMIQYLQRAIGYTLTGSTEEEAFFVITGPTASGKSTFIDAIMAVLGTYSLATDSETFTKGKATVAVSQTLAEMRGVRLVCISEVNENTKYDDAFVKRFTGGDDVTARRLYQEPFTYKPNAKLWIATNHEPSTRDEAMYRRMKRIKFPNTVPANERDPKLKEYLKNEGTRAVLRWAIEGAIEWYKDGLQEPKLVEEEVNSYRGNNDIIGMFLEEKLTHSKGQKTPFNDVYRRYAEWCFGMNLRDQLHPPALRDALVNKGIEVDRQFMYDYIVGSSIALTF